MHNRTPYSRLLRMDLLLHCMDLSSMLHVLETGETSWKQISLLMTFRFLHKVFGTLRGLASISKNVSFGEVLCLHVCSVHWEGTLQSQLLFPLIAVPKFVAKDKPFANFLYSSFSESKSSPLCCRSEYAVTLFPVLSKKLFQG